MITVIGSGARNLGMVGNYDAVLAATAAPFVMLADPDDVWKPGKISCTLDAMHRAEAESGVATPILVCTDAEVVDHQLQHLAYSYWAWSRVNPECCDSLSRLAVESPVLSSSVMVNRALLRLALPFTGAASCPDWWPALVAGAFGRIIRLPVTTFYYRRHSGNDSLDPFSSTVAGTIQRALADIAEPHRRIKRLVLQFAPQSAALVARFHDQLRPSDLAALEAAANLPSLGPFSRRWMLIRHSLWFSSPLKNLGFLLLV